MNCKKIHTDLIFYLGHELSPEKMEAIGRHLETCADCREFAKMLQSQLEIIDKEKCPEVSPYFYTRVMAKLDVNPTESKSLLPIWVQALAFSVLLIAAVTAGIYMGNQSSGINIQPTENNWLLMNDFESEPIESFLLDQP